MLTSLLTNLTQLEPNLQLSCYYKPAMTALSHALETQLKAAKSPIIFANFQQERFYRWESKRYGEFAQKAKGTYVLAVAETGFAEQPKVTAIPLAADDPMANEWHLVILDPYFCCAQILQEVPSGAKEDANRQFKGFWTMNPELVRKVAIVLVNSILERQPQMERQLLSQLFEQDLPDTCVSTNPEALTKVLLGNMQYAYEKLYTLGALQQVQAAQSTTSGL